MPEFDNNPHFFSAQFRQPPFEKPPLWRLLRQGERAFI
jgi:hypothetical protein